MILSGLEILRHLGNDITIEPFDRNQLNPNSYNLRLHNELLVYDTPVLDMKVPNLSRRSPSTQGLQLEPNRPTWAALRNTPRRRNSCPCWRRSSIGAGLVIPRDCWIGDVEIAGYWTLEMFCIQPIISILT